MHVVVTLDELRKARAKREKKEHTSPLIELPLSPLELPSEMRFKVDIRVKDGDIEVAMKKMRGSPDYNLFQLWSSLYYAQMRVEQVLESLPEE